MIVAEREWLDGLKSHSPYTGTVLYFCDRCKKPFAFCLDYEPEPHATFEKIVTEHFSGECTTHVE